MDDVKLVAPLFNAYRMFYKKDTDIQAAEKFINDRLINNESVIFVAFNDAEPVGFTQLYPIFSSVSVKRAWLLNDLYVAEHERGKGIAKALLNAARNHGIQTNSGWLMLQTAADNTPAQQLYESNGWEKDTGYLVYNLTITN